jgi:glycosyltransferase involved in cell wall biosynthesis
MVMRTDQLTVLLPTYNRPKYLKYSMLSLAAQKDIDFHLIILNNGSEHVTKGIIYDHLTKFRNLTSWNVLENEVNNPDQYRQMLEEVETEYVLLWTDDDVMEVNNLVKKMDVLRKNKNLGMCYSTVRLIDDAGNPHLKRGGDICSKLHDKDVLKKSVSFDALFPTCKISMPSCILKTEIVRKHDGSDVAIGGEWGCYLQALWDGHDTAFLAEPSVRLRLHDGSDTNVNGWGKCLFTDMHVATWRNWILNKGYKPNSAVVTELLGIYGGLLLHKHGSDFESLSRDMCIFMAELGLK